MALLMSSGEAATACGRDERGGASATPPCSGAGVREGRATKPPRAPHAASSATGHRHVEMRPRGARLNATAELGPPFARTPAAPSRAGQRTHHDGGGDGEGSELHGAWRGGWWRWGCVRGLDLISSPDPWLRQLLRWRRRRRRRRSRCRRPARSGSHRHGRRRLSRSRPVSPLMRARGLAAPQRRRAVPHRMRSGWQRRRQARLAQGHNRGRPRRRHRGLHLLPHRVREDAAAAV